MKLIFLAKFEEKDGKIPKISKLNKYDGFRYSNTDFIKLEAKVLICLDFGLTQPTAAHFAEYYIMGAIMPGDLKTASVSLRRVGEVSSNITSEFLDISLKGKIPIDIYLYFLSVFVCQGKIAFNLK